jgi:glutamate:GABA antiporter
MSEGTTPTVSELPPVTAPSASGTVFARKSSGLVKELGAFESFSINLISLGPGPAFGLFFTILLFVTGANLMDGVLIAALIAIPTVITYTLMAIEMPRSGGEYVYSSRMLHPYFGFVAGAARMMNVIIYAAVLPYWFVTLSVGPGFGAWGAITNNSMLTTWGNDLTLGLPTLNNLDVVIIGELVTLVSMVMYIVLKPRPAFRFFSALLILELLGLIVSVVLLAAMGHTSFVNTFNSFMTNNYGAPSGAYQYLASYGSTNFGAYGSSWTNTLEFVPLIFAFYFMFTTAPSYIAGEFRRSSRSIRLGMTISYLLAVIFSILLVFEFEQVVGMNFLNGSASQLYPGLYTGNAAFYLPYGAGLTSFPMMAAHGNNALIAIIFLGSISWYWLWIILGLYIFSRYALSFSLDRLFPKFMSATTRSTHSPIVGILVISALGLVLMPLMTYNYQALYTPFVFLLFFLPMITVSLTSLSLLRLGWMRHKPAYTLAGAVSFVITAVAAYLVTTLPLLGSAAGFTPSNQQTGYVTVILILVISAVWYFAARAYHKSRSGLDIALAFKELPPD